MTVLPNVPRDVIGLAALESGGRVDFGTSVPISFDGSHSFGLTGWFRLIELEATATLLGKGEEFELAVAAGVPFARIAGQIGRVGPDAALSEGWHFLAVSYFASGSGSGQLSLYVDGGLAGQATLSNVGAPASSSHLLVGGALDVQVWCVSAFDGYLEESEYACDWNPLTQASSTVAAFCFMTPPARDVGPNDIPIEFGGGAAEMYACPAVSFSGGSYATVEDPEVNIGTGPFTIQAWVLPQAEGSGRELVFAQGSSASERVALGLEGDGSALKVGAWRGSAEVTGGTVTPNVWHNVAVTYDGTTMTIYLDGEACGSIPVPEPSTIGSAALVLGAAANGPAPSVEGCFRGMIQTVDVWSKALTGAELLEYGEEAPVEAPGLLAVYVLAATSSDLVTTAPVELEGGAAPQESLIVPPGDGLARSDRQPEEPQGPVLDMSRSIDAERTAQLAEGFLRDLTASYDGPGRDEAVARVGQELGGYVAELRESGRLPAGIVFGEREGEELVFYRTVTGGGAVEVHRMPATGTCTDWYIEMVVAVIVGIFMVFGVPLAPRHLANAASRLCKRFPQLGRVVGQAFAEGVTITTITTALKALYTEKALSSLIWAALAELSWWEIVLAFAAIMLQFVEIIFPNPTSAAFYAMVIARIALAAMQIAAAYVKKPSGC